MGSLKAAFFRKEGLNIKEVSLVIYGKIGIAAKKIKADQFEERTHVYIIDGETFYKNRNKFRFYLARTKIKDGTVYLVNSKSDFFMSKWKRKKQTRKNNLKDWIFISKQQERRF